MILMNTKQGVIIATISDFRKFMFSKEFLRAGEIIKEGIKIKFFREDLKGKEHIPLNRYISKDELLERKRNFDYGGGEYIYLNIHWKDVIDWYDFDSFIFLNAEKIIELINDGELRVYDANHDKKRKI